MIDLVIVIPLELTHELELELELESNALKSTFEFVSRRIAL